MGGVTSSYVSDGTVMVFDDNTNTYFSGFLVVAGIGVDYCVITYPHEFLLNNIHFKCVVENVNRTGQTKVLTFLLIGYDVLSGMAIGAYLSSLNDGFELILGDQPFLFFLFFLEQGYFVKPGDNLWYAGCIDQVSTKAVFQGKASDNIFGGFNDGTPTVYSILLDGFAFPGMVGAPVVDQNGFVAGIITRKVSGDDYSYVMATSFPIMKVVFTTYLLRFLLLTPEQINNVSFMSVYLKHGFSVLYTGFKINYLGTGFFTEYPELETLLPTLAPDTIPLYTNNGQEIVVEYIPGNLIQTIGGMVLDDFIYALNSATGDFIYDPKQYINNFYTKLANPFSESEMFKNFYANSNKYPIVLLGISYLDFYESFSKNHDIYKMIPFGKFYRQAVYSIFKYTASWYGTKDWTKREDIYPAPFTLYYVYFKNGSWIFNSEYVLTQTVEEFDPYRNTYVLKSNFTMPEPLWTFQYKLTFHEL